MTELIINILHVANECLRLANILAVCHLLLPSQVGEIDIFDKHFVASSIVKLSFVLHKK